MQCFFAVEAGEREKGALWRGGRRVYGGKGGERESRGDVMRGWRRAGDGRDAQGEERGEVRRGGGGVGTAGENKVLRFCYNMGIMTFFVDFLEKIVYTSPIYVYMGGAYLCIY